jgi:hypothetical protein
MSPPTDLKGIEKWLTLLMHTDRGIPQFYLDCHVFLATESKQPPTWESRGQALYARIYSSSGRLDDKKFLEHVKDEVQRLPKSWPDPLYPHIGAWLGVFERVTHRASGLELNIRGPIVNMIDLPKNLLKLTRSYVKRRNAFLSNLPRPRYHGNFIHLWPFELHLPTAQDLRAKQLEVDGKYDPSNRLVNKSKV